MGLAVGAWSMDTDTGDERGSGSPPAAIDGTVASPGGSASTAAGLALPGWAATVRSIQNGGYHATPWVKLELRTFS